MSEPEAVNVLDALREDAAKIRRASTDLYRAMLEFDGGIDKDGQLVEGIQSQYQDAHRKALIGLEERYITAGERRPPADVREAMVIRQVRAENPELYGRFLALDALVSLLKMTISNRKASIGAYQSILKGERE